MESNKNEQIEYIKGVLEALLFVNERPVTIEQLKKVLDTVSVSDIKSAIAGLQKYHEEKNSGMNIVEIAGGYQMLSNPKYANYIREFYKTKHKEKLSKPALETLAIVAYKQPVTRVDVELIRGVNSDGVVSHLLEKELIKIVGRKDIPGRPYLYGTTKQFLEYFGLKTLETLPKLEDFPVLQPDYENPEEPQDEGSQDAVLSQNENDEIVKEESLSEEDNSPKEDDSSQVDSISEENSPLEDDNSSERPLNEANET